MLACWGFILLGSPLLVAYGCVSGAPWSYFGLAAAATRDVRHDSDGRRRDHLFVVGVDLAKVSTAALAGRAVAAYRRRLPGLDHFRDDQPGPCPSSGSSRHFCDYVSRNSVSCRVGGSAPDSSKRAARWCDRNTAVLGLLMRASFPTHCSFASSWATLASGTCDRALGDSPAVRSFALPWQMRWLDRISEVLRQPLRGTMRIVLIKDLRAVSP